MLRKPLCIQISANVPPRGAAGLRDLVLVVRKLQVEAAAVDVEVLAELVRATWPSTRCASRDGPRPSGEGHGGSPGFADFHSTKSSGSRLAVSTSTREPRAQVFELLAGQLSVRRELVHGVHHVAVAAPGRRSRCR